MNLRFFIDHCIPNVVVKSLSTQGYDVQLLRDYIPTDSDDEVVISKAQELDSILMTLDEDFSNIVNYPPPKYKGIIPLRVKNHPENIHPLIMQLLTYLSNHTKISHYKGKLII